MFKVNDKWFSLKLVEPYCEKLRRSDGTYTLGATDLDSETVYIRNDLSIPMFEKVLCHELVHCFCLAYDYYMDLKTEEICADFFATYGRKALDIADDIINLYEY